MRKNLLIIFTLISVFSFGQYKDANLWTGLAASGRLTKDLSVKWETQTRFYHNASALGQYYNELSVEYEIIKDLETSLTYRYSKKNTGNYSIQDQRFSYTGENRLAFDLGYGYDLGETGLDLKIRARYQYSFDRIGVINEVIYPDTKQMFRCKFRLRYKNDNFKRIVPYVSYEFYNAIAPKNTISSLDTYRLSAGIDLDLPKKIEATFFFIFENENRSEINQNFIYGIQLGYSFGKLYKKSKKKDSGNKNLKSN